MDDTIVWFEHLGMGDVERVGGKNASLGEMIASLAAKGVRVPGGFATTARAYREFLQQDGLDQWIYAELRALDVADVKALARTGAAIRERIIATPLPASLEQGITTAWKIMQERHGSHVTVAVRSSATAEDLPNASFAGQQETFLNVQGLDNLLVAIKNVFASLYNDRAIAYRVHKGFAHEKVALSAGVQKMVRSENAASGVIFTIDTESGFPDVVFITAAYGLGETVVQGAVNPDEFYVFKDNLRHGRPAIVRRSLGDKAIKLVYYAANTHDRTTITLDVGAADRARFCITDAQVEELARQALVIEQHYGRPMDIEWALDGDDSQLYIVQARPETVKATRRRNVIERYVLKQKATAVVTGRAIGQKIGAGATRVVNSTAEMSRVGKGDVLVTDMTDPDWEPIMKRAAAIVTNRGGRTCHAAIIARELGIPAVVGCGNATELLKDEEPLTVSCAEGDTGLIYRGILPFDVIHSDSGSMPQLPVKIMMNIGNPERAFDVAQLPNAGVGLARLEFIINSMIGVHPRALLEFRDQPIDTRNQIREKMAGYSSPREFYVAKLTEGISTLAAAFHGKPVIVRMSDFKSNEYANLLGGERYEPREENPMLGLRGAARYLDPKFRTSVELECEAFKRVRNDMGFINVEIMIPFVRTLDEARGVIDLLAANGLRRGDNGLRIIMMCEIPSNALLASEFLDLFDGFSIGSNDMTQLTLGIDRDSGLITAGFDERNPAVKKLLAMAISTARAKGKYIGICGQGPSDHPDFAEWLLQQGIHSLSLNPDAVIDTWIYLGQHSGSKRLAELA